MTRTARILPAALVAALLVAAPATAAPRSLDALGMDHVDLYLIHWPPRDGSGLSSWEQLLALQAEGLARAVGVAALVTAALVPPMRERLHPNRH